MGEQKKIAYIVEDDSFLRMLYEEELADAGFSVITFDSVDRAVRHMGIVQPEMNASPLENRPHLLVTDYDTASNYNGLHLLKHLKGQGIGLILQSGNVNIDEKQVKAAGGDSAIYIDKGDPNSPDLAVLARKAVELAVLSNIGIRSNATGRHM